MILHRCFPLSALALDAADGPLWFPALRVKAATTTPTTAVSFCRPPLSPWSNSSPPSAATVGVLLRRRGPAGLAEIEFGDDATLIDLDDPARFAVKD